jgi:hypothetical protein
VSSKLGFEIVQEPYLKRRHSEENPLGVEIGRPLDLLLTGGRIWRSTEVTLGSQKANDIVVLPNMEGIVAHFDCVELQTPLSDANPAVQILVWTSEGVTEPDYAKLVVPAWLKNASTEKATDPAQEVCMKKRPEAPVRPNMANANTATH